MFRRASKPCSFSVLMCSRKRQVTVFRIRTTRLTVRCSTGRWHSEPTSPVGLPVTPHAPVGNRAREQSRWHLRMSAAFEILSGEAL